MGVINMWPFKQRPEDAFDKLVRPHLKQMYNLAYRYTGHAEDAEDLVQDVLFKLFPRLEEMQQIEQLAPWLNKVLYRQFVDHHRRGQRSPIDFSDDEQALYDSRESDWDGPAQTLNRELTGVVLEQALHQLNEEQRVLLLLHDVEGYSLQEVNAMTDVPIGTLKSRLSRSRKKLQEILQNVEPESP